ncbi:hypothetical protein EMCRGX_G021084 [Ephydatia muelleri]
MAGQPPTFDEDPAAAFLAQEQDVLGGLVDEIAPSQPQTDHRPSSPSIERIDEREFDNQEEHGSADDPYSVIGHMDNLAGEPECIQKWRQEQTALIQKKDEAEGRALDELKAQAKKDIEEWYGRHEELLNQTKASNRQAEKALIEERDDDIAGRDWERVGRLCDFNPKNNKSTKDTSRMRSILLQLKQTPLVRD